MIPGTIGLYGSRNAATTVTFVGASSSFHGNTAGTVTYHASTASGDFLFLFQQCDDVDSPQTPSGWTNIFTSSDTAGGGRGHLSYRFCAGETSVFCADPGDHLNAAVLTFRGVQTATPFIQTGLSYDSTDTGLIIPGPTSVIDNSYIVYLFFHETPTASGVASNWANANITGGTELIDDSTTFGWDGGYAVWGGYKTSAGACGNTTVDVNTASSWKIRNSFALQPSV